MRLLARCFVLPLAFSLLPVAFAGTLSLGFLALDPVPAAPTTSEQLDIFNGTGANSSTLFPVKTSVSFSDLMLTVKFSDNSSHVYTDFSLASDNLSFVGNDLFPIAGIPAIESATLTGKFDTTALTLLDNETTTINPGFSTLLTQAGGLPLGDFALITASTATVPEPASVATLACGLGALLLFRRKRLA